MRWLAVNLRRALGAAPGGQAVTFEPWHGHSKINPSSQGGQVDTIDKARAEMERMDSLYARAEARGASPATLDELAQATADAEAAYYRACDFWEPAS